MKKSVYAPNVLRTNAYQHSKDFNTSIEYSHNIDLNTSEFRLLLHANVCKIMELMFFYDVVYLDLSEFFVVVDELLKVDEHITIKFLKKGTLSFISSVNYLFGTKAKNVKYVNLACGTIKSPEFVNNEELLLSEFHNYGSINGKLDDIYKKVYSHAIVYDEKYHIIFLNEANSELLTNKNLLEIKVGEGNLFLAQNCVKINTFLEMKRGLWVLEACNLNDIYFDDVFSEMYNKLYTKTGKKISELTELLLTLEIPDIHMMLIYKQIDYSSLMKLKGKKAFRNVRKFVFGNEAGLEFVVKRFLNQIVTGSSSPMKEVGTAILGEFVPGIGTSQTLYENIFPDLQKSADILKRAFIKTRIGEKPLQLVNSNEYKKHFEVIDDTKSIKGLEKVYNGESIMTYIDGEEIEIDGTNFSKEEGNFKDIRIYSVKDEVKAIRANAEIYFDEEKEIDIKVDDKIYYKSVKIKRGNISTKVLIGKAFQLDEVDGMFGSDFSFTNEWLRNLDRTLIDTYHDVAFIQHMLNSNGFYIGDKLLEMKDVRKILGKKFTDFIDSQRILTSKLFDVLSKGDKLTKEITIKQVNQTKLLEYLKSWIQGKPLSDWDFDGTIGVIHLGNIELNVFTKVSSGKRYVYEIV